MSAVRIEPRNSTCEIEFHAERIDGSALKAPFYRNFLTLEPKFLGNVVLPPVIVLLDASARMLPTRRW